MVDLGKGRTITATQLCERFGFVGNAQWTPVGELSGGERRRLQLLRLLMDEPNVLVLDEPTNDLDIDTLTALEDLLDGWPGTLLVVSHDRYFVERVCDREVALLGDGRLRDLPGGVDEYLALRRAAGRRSRAEVDPDPPRRRAGRSTYRRLMRAPDAAATRGWRARSWPGWSGRMEKLRDREVRLHADLAAAATDHEQVLALDASLRALHDERATLEHRWLELAEQLRLSAISASGTGRTGYCRRHVRRTRVGAGRRESAGGAVRRDRRGRRAVVLHLRHHRRGARCAGVAAQGRRERPACWPATSAPCSPATGARTKGRRSRRPACSTSRRTAGSCCPSPNGSSIAFAAVEGGVTALHGGVAVIAGCLRNATAVARYVRDFERIGVVPAGERWGDGSLRPAYEDLVGAGAVIDRIAARDLSVVLTPEAEAAAIAFRALRPLEQCPSGQELVERGFAEDVRIASQLDVSDVVPRLTEGRFVAA